METPELIASIIGMFFAYIFPIIAYFWIDKLEKTNCKCSEHWERSYMKNYIYFIFIWITLNLILAIILKTHLGEIINNTFGATVFGIVQIVLLLIGVGYTFMAIDYINNLKKIDCKCSEDIKREVIFIVNIFAACGYALIFVMFIISILFGITIFRNPKLQPTLKNVETLQSTRSDLNFSPKKSSNKSNKSSKKSKK